MLAASSLWQAATKLEDVDRWTRSTRWKPWSLYNGIRIYEINLPPAAENKAKRRPPCRKVQVSQYPCGPRNGKPCARACALDHW